MLPKNIIAGFKITGIFPVDKKQFSSDLFDPVDLEEYYLSQSQLPSKDQDCIPIQTLPFSDSSSQTETEILDIDFNPIVPEDLLSNVIPLIQNPLQNDQLPPARPSCSHWNDVDPINLNPDKVISSSQVNQSIPIQEQVTSPLLSSFVQLKPNKKH